MGKTRVVLDTNILISALGWNGKLRDIFKKCTCKKLHLVTSYEQIEELHKAMRYEKFNFKQKQIDIFLSVILNIAEITQIEGKLKIIHEDPKDDAIIETAIVGKADYLISGDRHLLKLKEQGNIKILTPAAFVNLQNFCC